MPGVCALRVCVRERGEAANAPFVKTGCSHCLAYARPRRGLGSREGTPSLMLLRSSQSSPAATKLSASVKDLHVTQSTLVGCYIPDMGGGASSVLVVFVNSDGRTLSDVVAQLLSRQGSVVNGVAEARATFWTGV